MVGRRPVDFLHDACVDLLLEVSDRGNRAEDCFSHARVGPRHTRATPDVPTAPLPRPRSRGSRSTANRYNDARSPGVRAESASGRGQGEAQIFDCNLSTVNLSTFRDLSVFWFPSSCARAPCASRLYRVVVSTAPRQRELSRTWCWTLTRSRGSFKKRSSVDRDEGECKSPPIILLGHDPNVCTISQLSSVKALMIGLLGSFCIFARLSLRHDDRRRRRGVH